MGTSDLGSRPGHDDFCRPSYVKLTGAGGSIKVVLAGAVGSVADEEMRPRKESTNPSLGGVELHVVCDNYPTHQHPKVKA